MDFAKKFKNSSKIPIDAKETKPEVQVIRNFCLILEVVCVYAKN